LTTSSSLAVAAAVKATTMTRRVVAALALVVTGQRPTPSMSKIHIPLLLAPAAVVPLAMTTAAIPDYTAARDDPPSKVRVVVLALTEPAAWTTMVA